MKIEIKTNNHKRDLVSLYELPEKAQSDFDYVDKEDSSYRFVNYRGNWYDVYESQAILRREHAGCFSMSVDEDSPFAKWNAIQSDSYFSGIVFRYPKDDCGREDFDHIICGTYFS